MLEALMSIWEVLSRLWRTIPESTRNDIKEMAVDGVEGVFRRYYADAKQKAGEA